MCRKDRSEKYLEDYPEIFADIYNVLVFKEPLLHPAGLVSAPTETVNRNGGGNLQEKRRDVAKYYMEEGAVKAELGIENQSFVDRDMPIRVSDYDAASYRAQIRKGADRYPVKTIVLNFGEKRWESPFSLSDVIKTYQAKIQKTDKRFTGYIEDYGIEVYDVAFLPEEIRKKFTSDFRIVADFFAGKRNGNYIPSTEEIRHVEALLEFFKIFTEDERFGEMAEKMRQKKEKGECVNMCTILDQYIEIGMERGIEQGMEQGMEQGKSEGWRQVAEVAALLREGVSLDELLSMDYPRELVDIAASII